MALSSHATVRPSAFSMSNENRARSFASTTPTLEHSFCGGGAERPKRCDTGLPSSSHLSCLTDDDEEGERDARRRGGDDADAAAIATATTTNKRATCTLVRRVGRMLSEFSLLSKLLSRLRRRVLQFRSLRKTERSERNETRKKKCRRQKEKKKLGEKLKRKKKKKVKKQTLSISNIFQSDKKMESPRTR